MPTLATCAYFHPPILILSILSTLILILQVPVHCMEGTFQLFIALIRCMGGAIISFFDTLWSVLPVAAPVSPKVFYLPCEHFLPFC